MNAAPSKAEPAPCAALQKAFVATFFRHNASIFKSMKMTRLFIVTAAGATLATALFTGCHSTGGCGMACCADQSKAENNTLTKQEKADGWKLLWDGKTTDGWRSPKSDIFPSKSWVIENGEFRVVSSGNAEAQAGGDIITRERYANFDLSADFKFTTGCNSGIKIFVQPNISPVDKVTGKPTGKGSAIGLEYQILDDANHPDAKLGRDGDRKLGALYDLFPCDPAKPVNPAGEWNHARILSRGTHVEHWLNGRKILEYDRGSTAFREAVAKGKFKNIPDFGEWADGHILLQEHGSEVSFRNIKIRVLPPN